MNVRTAYRQKWQSVLRQSVPERMVKDKSFFRTLAGAKLQCDALAAITDRGRWYVIPKGKRFEVRWDECAVRDGVDESERIYQATCQCRDGNHDYRSALFRILGIESYGEFSCRWKYCR